MVPVVDFPHHHPDIDYIILFMLRTSLYMWKATFVNEVGKTYTWAFPVPYERLSKCAYCSHEILSVDRFNWIFAGHCHVVAWVSHSMRKYLKCMAGKCSSQDGLSSHVVYSQVSHQTKINDIHINRYDAHIYGPKKLSKSKLFDLWHFL